MSDNEYLIMNEIKDFLILHKFDNVNSEYDGFLEYYKLANIDIRCEGEYRVYVYVDNKFNTEFRIFVVGDMAIKNTIPYLKVLLEKYQYVFRKDKLKKLLP